MERKFVKWQDSWGSWHLDALSDAYMQCGHLLHFLVGVDQDARP
ncbi:hypothetical protein RQM65_17680 [Pricia sp. S334]|uniref:Uncharacterized protein n=1 Tax=Pricia mediterranea TaxID=3076079 RepID=A0ABU3L9T6_9FLAO|nr:hypothetical protein [Pricia sp. S334]MDT7830504.1 hypothetical protein [Pricia sp. S334]